METIAVPVTQVRSARGALAALSLCTLLSALGTSSANIALPALTHAFHASFQQVQWVVIAYLLAVTTLIVSIGKLGDMVGRRRLLCAGIGLFTLNSLLAALAPSLPLLIVARAGQGLGAAAMMALAIAFVGETVAKSRTGSAMGLLGTMSAVGTALGPSLGGLLIHLFGWRTIFQANVLLGVFTLLLAMRFLPRVQSPARCDSNIDPLGMLLLAFALAAWALAMTMGRGSFGPLNLVLLAAAAMGAVLFVLAEYSSTAPMLPMSMFGDRKFSASMLMSALVSTVMMATLVVGPFYLARGFGLDPAAVGLALAVGPVAAAIAGVPAGRLTDRFGATPMALLGIAGIGSGSLALSLVPHSLGVGGYLACTVLITIHFSLFQTANNTAVMGTAEASQRGVISGVLNLSRNLGFVTGASVMGALFAHGSGTTNLLDASPVQVAHGLHVTFMVAAGLIVLAGAIGIAVHRK